MSTVTAAVTGLGSAAASYTVTPATPLSKYPTKATPSLAIGTNTGVTSIPAGTYTCTDFAEAAGYAGMWFLLNPVAGIVGAGTGQTILTMTPKTSTKAAVAHAVPNGGSILFNLARIGGYVAGSAPYLSGLTFVGTDQGHDYNGLMMYKCSGAVVQDVEVATIPGSSAGPPGETFSINDWQGNANVYRRLHLHDGGGSLFGSNSSRDVLVEDSTFTGSKFGYGSALWTVTNATFRRCTWSGNQHGPANNERVNGQVLYEDCTFTKGANSYNPWHLQFDNDTGSATVRIVDPVFDGPKLVVRLHTTYAGNPAKQLATDIHLIVGGVERPDLLQIVH